MLFVAAFFLGGMLTVSSESVYLAMATIVEGSMFVIDAIFGVQ